MPRGGMFIHDGIGPVIAYMAGAVVANVADAMQEGKAQLEAQAQANAPWSDITGRARQGLVAEVSVEGGEVVLTLAHSVDYGLWLEVIQEGRFAIIMPTIEALAPEILKNAGAVVTRTGSSY